MAVEDRLVWLGLPDASGRALLARYFRPWYGLLAFYVILASVQSLGNLPVLWLRIIASTLLVSLVARSLL